MGALSWEIQRADSLVLASGVGVFDFNFFADYRKAMQAESASHYRKLLDFRRTDIVLSPYDLDRISAEAQFDRLTAGPVAIIMGKTPPPLLVDMATLLQHRVGLARRIRLFIDEGEARKWLASEPIRALPGPARSRIWPIENR